MIPHHFIPFSGDREEVLEAAPQPIHILREPSVSGACWLATPIVSTILYRTIVFNCLPIWYVLTLFCFNVNGDMTWQRKGDLLNAKNARTLVQ